MKSVREIQRLSIFGEAGQAASTQMDATAVLEGYRQMEQITAPLDFHAFNAYHHGAKMMKQNRELLEQALELGAVDGAQMPATRALLEQLPAT